jgi:hypothetical protein
MSVNMDWLTVVTKFRLFPDKIRYLLVDYFAKLYQLKRLCRMASLIKVGNQRPQKL